jgi:hypothetical protein
MSPIAINGSGTITGISVGGIPDGVVDTDVLAANAVTYAKIGTTEQGQLCKAWVNFNGTSTVAIRASYNVSSITDNGTGNYTVNFTTAMVDANYSICGTVGRGAGFTTPRVIGIGNTNPTSSAAQVSVVDDAANLNDCEFTMVAIFR